MSPLQQASEITRPGFGAESAASRALSQVLPSEYFEPRWYAAYTCARHEKRVAEQLRLRGVESFLPLYERVQRWKNRQRVRLQLPLFPGYTFVRIALKDRLQVLEIPSVVRLVGFNGTPTPLADEEIEGLRQALAEGVRAESHPYLKIGRRVRITTGPLAGYEGILVRRKGTLRVVLSAELIQRSILLDVDGLAVEPVGSSPNRACPFRGERDGSGSLTPCDSSAGTSPLLRPPQQNQLTRRR